MKAVQITHLLQTKTICKFLNDFLAETVSCLQYFRVVFPLVVFSEDGEGIGAKRLWCILDQLGTKQAI